MSEKKLTVYVDGSFNPTVNRYAYGCVLIYEDEVIEELCGSGCDPEALKQRNVSGEMIASMLSVQYALKNGFNSLDIYYDYLKGKLTRIEFIKLAPASALKTVICETMSDTTLPQIFKTVDGIIKLQGIKSVDVIIGGPPCQA